MAKALMILADGFEEVEAIAPLDLLRRAGVQVTLAGLSQEGVISARGVAVTADTTLERAGSGFDALVLPGGGEGAKNLAASRNVKERIVDMFKRGTWVCAICASPVLVLAPTGILKGKSATCYKGMESGFGSEVNYVDRRVVTDGNVITSQGPGTAIDFALAIIEELEGKAASEKIRADVLA